MDPSSIGRLEAYLDLHWTGTWPALARRAGVSAPALYHWLNDKHDPSLSGLRRLAKALDTRVYEVVAAIEGEDVVVPDLTIAVDDERQLRITIEPRHQ